MTARDEDLGVAIVSDVHLSPACDGAERDAALCQLAAWLATRSRFDGHPWRLLLLGDLLDLPQAGADDPAVLRTIERTVAAHAPVFSALRDLAADGCPVVVVPGNHDVALLRPAVLARFRQLAGPVTLLSWLYHVPGLLYAEHGHQYHDINAFPRLLAMGGADIQIGDWPLAPRLAALVSGSATIWSALRTSLVPQREAYRASFLAGHADDVGLERETLAALDELAAVASVRAVATRLIRARAWRRRSAEERGRYLRARVPTIHDVLRQRGCDVPFYAFGHTHHAEDRFIGSGRARYLNTGAWPADGSLPWTFIEVSRRKGESLARLLRWPRHRDRPEPVEDAARLPALR